jgi:hypothetical protein
VPIRGTIAVIATVIAVALMASFKTPDLTSTHPAKAPTAIGAPPGGDSAEQLVVVLLRVGQRLP